MSTFGKRLKELRQERNLTGEDLGKILSVSKTAISNWENGNRFPQDEKMLKAIADYFNVSLDYLLNRTDDPNIVKVNRELNKDNFEIDVNNKYPYELTPDQIKKMIDDLYKSGFNIDKLIEKAKNQD